MAVTTTGMAATTIETMMQPISNKKTQVMPHQEQNKNTNKPVGCNSSNAKTKGGITTIHYLPDLPTYLPFSVTKDVLALAIILTYSFAT